MENKHGYWIHQRIKDDTAVSGFFYERKCNCSECGYEANMEKKICPHCGAIMDKEHDAKVA